MFFAAKLVVWTLTQAVMFGGTRDFTTGLVFAGLFGVAFGYWMVALMAALDVFSRRWTSGPRTVGLFAVMVTGLAGLTWAVFAFGPGHPSNKVPLYDAAQLLILGLSFAVVATCYLLRGLMRPS